VTGLAWSDAENAAIVADYFAMLHKELTRQKYSKAKHNRDMQKFIERSRGSIEFKHQNISAVLMGLGEPWILGYKPATNFQESLADAVVRHMIRATGFEELVPPPIQKGAEAIKFGPAPTMRNAPPEEDVKRLLGVARKYDAAEREARNRRLGRAGEERVLSFEKAKLSHAGRDDLAEKVRWVSDLDGDGAGYDIASFEPEGRRRLIEVKTTNGWERSPFHITRNELDVATNRSDEWCLVRVWNFARSPQAFELRPPLEPHVSLIATNFRAEFTARHV
jgi:hypothetical protein